MDRDTQGKVFQPFFTTKEVGKGTVLGLSMVHGMVNRHNGDITLKSEPERGFVFNIYLPLAEAGKAKKNLAFFFKAGERCRHGARSGGRQGGARSDKVSA